MSRNSTSRASTACSPSLFRVEPVQSELDRSFLRRSMSSSGLNCSNFSSSRILLRIRVLMGKRSLSLPGFCGVGRRKVSLTSSFADVFRRLFI